MLTLAPYQLIQLYWPLPLEQQQVQPELGKSKFHKLHAAIQQGKPQRWQDLLNCQNGNQIFVTSLQIVGI
jgi:hypothetical protein